MTKVRIPKWLKYGECWFPSEEARDYVEYTFFFGRPQREYSVSGDRDLLSDGAILETRTLKSRSVFIACIPTEIEDGSEFANEWRMDFFPTEELAIAALKAGLEVCDAVPPWDDDDDILSGEFDLGPGHSPTYDDEENPRREDDNY